MAYCEQNKDREDFKGCRGRSGNGGCSRNQCELGIRYCFHDRLSPGRIGGALVAPTVNVSLGMDHTLIMEAFLIVIIGGLGNIWGALLGALIFGLAQSLGILIWPQFGIVFPYAAVIVVLLLRPTGLLKSTW